MRLVLALSAALALFAQDSTQLAQDAPKTGKVFGYVKDAATGQAIEGAAIYLDHEAIGQWSDASGRYSLAAVPEGPHYVAARARNDVAGQANRRMDGRAVTVAAGNESAIDLPLTRLASIEGTVLDPDRRPFKSAMVVILQRQYGAGGLRYERVATAVSDASGVYRFKGVTAGEPFAILAGKLTREPAATSGGGTLSGIDTFYPHAPTPELGEEIVLLPDEARTRADIRILQAPTYCANVGVSGGDQPIKIRIGAASLWSTSAADNETDSAGAFRVCGLAAGEYRASFTAPVSGKGGRKLGQGVIFTVDKSDVELRTALREQKQALTQLVNGGQSKIGPAITAGIFLLTPFGAAGAVKEFKEGSDPFPLDEPFDEYRVAAALSRQTMRDGLYVKDIFYGGKRVGGGTVEPAGANLTIVAATDGGRIAATAQDADSKPVAYATVALMPIEAATEAEFASGTQLGHADQNGGWQSGAVAPGRHLILATTEPLDMKSFRIDKLWAARTRAKEIEVAPNANLQVNINVQSLSSR